VPKIAQDVHTWRSDGGTGMLWNAAARLVTILMAMGLLGATAGPAAAAVRIEGRGPGGWRRRRAVQREPVGSERGCARTAGSG
jgi:hypothetical protein